jgi:hypothetical protein
LDLSILRIQGLLFTKLFKPFLEGIDPHLPESIQLLDRKSDPGLRLTSSKTMIFFTRPPNKPLGAPKVPERIFLEQCLDEGVQSRADEPRLRDEILRG